MANKLREFLKSQKGISMFLALQIFLLKSMRTKNLVVVAFVLLIAGHIIGTHIGFCPLKNIKPCQLFEAK